MPEGLFFAFVLSVGYPAYRPLAVIDRLNRRPFDEVVHRCRWGPPSASPAGTASYGANRVSARGFGNRGSTWQWCNRRLVERSRPAAVGALSPGVAPAAGVAVHAVYDGQRTAGVYDQATHRVTISEGPLAGTSYKSPSGAAIAVVTNCRPDVNPNRNGWSFWTVTTTGRLLQTLRDN